MTIPLVVLALGSIFAGYVGVPHAVGGSNWIEGFLHPSFEAAEAHPAAAASVTAQEEAHAADVGLERTLMAVSSGIAVAGIAIAMFFWLRRPDVPAALARRFGAVYRLLLNKYYVDDVYDAVFVQPIKRLSTNVFWRGVDAGLIDGTVNGVGAAVSGSSSALRRLQTGSVRTYAVSLLLGAVGIVGWYLWR